MKIKTIRLIILGTFLTLLMSNCKNKSKNVKEDDILSATETLIENGYTNTISETDYNKQKTADSISEAERKQWLLSHLDSYGRLIIRNKETRLGYEDFTVVFLNFNGLDNSNPYLGLELDTTEFALKVEDSVKILSGEDGYDYYEYYSIETLTAKKDTVNLYETWNRLEDTDDNNVIGDDVVIQIIAKNKNDRFKISHCYLSDLYETMEWKERNFNDDGKRRTDEEYEIFHKSLFRVAEQTPYIALNDSSGFFRPKLYTEYYERTTTYGKWQEEQYLADILRLKEKYGMRDTSVTLSGDCVYPATLTKDKRLFSYVYWGHLFRIEHFRNDKKIATKYIIVNIFDGC
jgi:hypothetical protein